MDVAGLAVTIWLIQPTSEKYVSIIRIFLLTKHIRDQTSFHPRTPHVYWQKSAVYLTYDLGCRKNRIAKVPNPTNRFSQRIWKWLRSRWSRKDPAKSSHSLLWFLRALKWPHPHLRLSNTTFNPEAVSLLQVKINQVKQAVNVVLYLHRKSLCCVGAAEHLLWTPHNSCTFLHLLSTQKKTQDCEKTAKSAVAVLCRAAATEMCIMQHRPMLPSLHTEGILTTLTRFVSTWTLAALVPLCNAQK